MSQERPDRQEPRIVVFAPSARLGEIAADCAAAAAVVVTGEPGDIDADAVAAARATGCPVMLATTEADAARGFDGLYLETDSADLVKAARRALAAGASLGTGGATTRHQAMALGDGLPDFVLFGSVGAGERPDRSADPDLISWWNELFEVASVAVATSADEAVSLLEAGADFIAVHDLLWGSSNPAETLSQLNGALAKVEARSAEAVE